MRCALYARISRPDEVIENQILKLQDFATAKGWEVAKRYEDVASGASTDRPRLAQLRRDARGHAFDVVVVQRVDRLARSTRHLLNLLDELKHEHVALVCTEQQFDTSAPEGHLILTVLSAVSEIELELIRARTCDGLSRARRQGKVLGRPKSPVSTERLLELRTQGLSLRAIAQQTGLSHAGVRKRLRMETKRCEKSK